jgi:hypothetical protein
MSVCEVDVNADVSVRGTNGGKKKRRLNPFGVT